MSYNVDNLGWLALGAIIGFVVGYFVRGAHRFADDLSVKLDDIKEEVDDIKEELDEVDDIVKKRDDPKSGLERGAASWGVVSSAALCLVVVFTAYASFSSQVASNHVKSANSKIEETQDDLKAAQSRIDRLVFCNQVTLSKALIALNERTTYSSEQAAANVEVLKVQQKMLLILLHKPPYTEEVRVDATHTYTEALEEYLTLNAKTQAKVAKNQYPNIDDLAACIDQAASTKTSSTDDLG